MILESLNFFGFWTNVLIVLCGVLTAYYVIRSRSLKNAKKLPPGPGSNLFRMMYGIFKVLFFPEKTHERLKNMGKIYGPMYTLPMGTRHAIMIDDFSILRKAYVEMGDDFSGRGMNDFSGIVEQEERKSLVLADGPFWREHRRFMLSSLRDFGIGKTSIEPAILVEIDYFLKEFEKKGGEAFDPFDLMGMTVSNVIFQLSIGKRFDYDDPEFMQLKTAMDENMKLQETVGMEMMMPFLKYIPFMDKLTQKDRFTKNYFFVKNYFKKVIENHNANYKQGSKTDFIDAYITEKNERVEQNRFPEMFDDATLIQNLNLLFLAGKETTSYTLLWSLLYMIVHPDIQRKVQKEIDDVIGRERMPSYEDKKRMPYTDAVMMEVQRISCVVTFNGQHVTTTDVSLAGYDFPKGTMFLNNFWSTNHDEKLFPDPQTFRPERFINEEGKAVKPEYLIPFSFGKRFCVGEPLARMELFLYFTSMLQRFSFKIPDGDRVCTERTRFISGGLERFRLQASPRD